jgi:hypothetical protein
MMMMTRRALTVAIALGISALPAYGASISGLNLTDNSNPGSASGCCPSCAQTKTSLGIVSQTASSFTTRFAQIIAADARLTTPIGISLNSSYTLSFEALCPPGGYELAVTTRAKGAFTHVDDSLGCGVAGNALSNLSVISGLQSGGTLSGSLGLPDPGGVGPTSSNVNVPFDLSGTATISGISVGAGVSHTLVFNWSGSCDSQATAGTCGAECAVRMGLAADSPLACPTDNISADDYPGVGGRNAADDGHFVSVTLNCLCGNGTINGGEQCDEGAANGTSESCCTALCQLVPEGNACRPAVNECDETETCNGLFGDCPADGFVVSGNGCVDDGNECTNDVCDGAGACLHPNKSGGATCNAGAGVCDGAGACVAPPTPSPTPTPTPLCAATPRAGCRGTEPQKSSLFVRNKDGTVSDRLTWKWNRGAATSLSEFGSPTTSTSYALCVYDTTAGAPSLVASLRAPAGGTCASGRPCWRSVSTRGFKYQNAGLVPDGLLKLQLGAGTTGKAKIVALAKGPPLTLPFQASGTVFRQDPRVTVQLVNDAPMGVCWETRFTAPATRNLLEQFKDKSD